MAAIPELVKELVDEKNQDQYQDMVDACRRSKRQTDFQMNPKDYRIPGQYRYNGIVLGYYMPGDHIDAIKKLDLVESDVIVASYPKTGTTITMEMVYLIRHDGNTDEANKEYNYVRVPFLDMALPPDINGLTLYKDLPHPRHLKTHLPFELMPEKVTTHGIKCVYVLRNPKDTLVSLYYFYKCGAIFGCFTASWSDFFEMFLHDNIFYGNILDHYLGWWKHRNDPNILILKYEDLVITPREQIERIARFLEKPTKPEIIDTICEATRFKNMKANPSTNFSSVPADRLDLTISPFMRKGKIGDWKNHFTVAQNHLMDQIIQSKLRGSELDFDYDGA